MNSTTQTATSYDSAVRTTYRTLSLQWKGPWWMWQMMSWCIITLTSPIFFGVILLLLNDARSDHPVFWASLPVIVAITHAMAIFRTNQQHHRKAFRNHHQATINFARHCCFGGVLFLLSGLFTGFLPEFITPFIQLNNTSYPLLVTLGWCALLSGVLAVLAFAHSGYIHAHMAFYKNLYRNF